MAVNINDLFQVRYYHSQGNQLAVVVRHFKVVNTGGIGLNEQDLADAASNDYQAVIRPLMNVQARYRGLQLRKIKPVVGADFVSVVGAAQGTSIGSAYASQVAGLVSLRSAFPGKSKRGRMFVPFPSEDDSDINGLPVASYITRLNTLADLNIGNKVLPKIGFPADTVTWVGQIHSRKLNTEEAVVTRIARTAWATQRRRSQLNRSDIFLP